MPCLPRCGGSRSTAGWRWSPARRPGSAPGSRGLASVGARVAVVARRADRLAELAAEIDGQAVPCDLLDLDAVRGVVPQVVDGLGPPEILVNAAGGLVSRDRAEAESLDAIRQTLDLNLTAPMLLAQAVFPHMVGGGARCDRPRVVDRWAGRCARHPAGVLCRRQDGPLRPDRRAGRAVGRALDPGEHGGAGLLPQRDHRRALRRRAGPGPGSSATRPCRSKAPSTTSWARCSGWSATPAAMSPARPSSSTAAGRPGSEPAPPSTY